MTNLTKQQSKAILRLLEKTEYILNLSPNGAALAGFTQQDRINLQVTISRLQAV